MTPVISCTRALTEVARKHGADLLATAQEPHDEVLTLLWGPRFDREHALGLWVSASGRQPVESLVVLPALMAAADRFDELPATAQHRLRRLVLRHRRLGAAAARV